MYEYVPSVLRVKDPRAGDKAVVKLTFKVSEIPKTNSTSVSFERTSPVTVLPSSTLIPSARG